MAPNSSWSEITTTALKYRMPKIFDQISDNVAIVHRFRDKGRVKIVDGGESIVVPLEYAENGTYLRYSGYEPLNISPSEVFSAAEFSWKQIAISVSISGLEQLQNSGRQRQHDLLKARIANAERTFINNFATDLYSDGSGTGSKQIGGLQHLVADADTATVGGISRVTYSWWRNYNVDASADYGASPAATNIQSYMNRVWLEVTRNGDSPDLILADNTYYRYYWESLQAIQRINSSKMAEAGFESIRYKNADVVFDGGQGGHCPTEHMYFLNTDYIGLAVHKDRNLVPLEPDRFATNHDAMVKLLGFAGNMFISNTQLQAVLED